MNDSNFDPCIEHTHTKKNTRTETNTRLNIQNKTKKNEKNRVAGRTNWLDRQTDRQAK